MAIAEVKYAFINPIGIFYCYLLLGLIRQKKISAIVCNLTLKYGDISPIKRRPAYIVHQRRRSRIRFAAQL
jgi:hypothetical protein